MRGGNVFQLYTLSPWRKDSLRAFGLVGEGTRHTPTLRRAIPFQGRPEGCQLLPIPPQEALKQCIQKVFLRETSSGRDPIPRRRNHQHPQSSVPEAPKSRKGHVMMACHSTEKAELAKLKGKPSINDMKYRVQNSFKFKNFMASWISTPSTAWPSLTPSSS